MIDSATHPGQSPSTAYGVVPTSIGTCVRATPRWFRSILCTTLPAESTNALIPVLVARSSQRRCSMLRTAANMRCCSCSWPAPYQESFVKLTIAWARP